MNRTLSRRILSTGSLAAALCILAVWLGTAAADDGRHDRASDRDRHERSESSHHDGQESARHRPGRGHGGEHEEGEEHDEDHGKDHDKGHHRKRPSISVMTWNQYLGASLVEALGSLISTTGQVVDQAVVVGVLSTLASEVAASHTEDRLSAQANIIREKRPHVIGLQEVVSVDFQCFVDNQACSADLSAGLFGSLSINPAAVDHLESTEANLADQYTLSACRVNLDVAIPIPVQISMPVQPLAATLVVTIKDRDVLFVRNDIETTSEPEAGCSDGAGFGDDNLVFPNPFANEPVSLSLNRGYLSTDVAINDKTFRIFNTHLETKSADPMGGEVQQAQAEQLAMAAFPLDDSGESAHVIVLGDFNSTPNDLSGPYGILTSAGLVDIWTYSHGADVGETCCQSANLRNPDSMLDQRIDLILTDSEPRHVVARRVGHREDDKVAVELPGDSESLWPSDHAGVWARLWF